MLGLEHNSWILVCDGKKALYLENAGTAREPHLEVRQVQEHEDPRSRDINSDGPGRAFSSAGGRPASMDDGDAHELSEQRFLKSTARRLEKLREHFEFQDLVLVAPPKALGVMREALAPALRKMVRTEVEKDLVNLPVPEIERHLRAIH